MGCAYGHTMAVPDSSSIPLAVGEHIFAENPVGYPGPHGLPTPTQMRRPWVNRAHFGHHWRGSFMMWPFLMVFYVIFFAAGFMGGAPRRARKFPAGFCRNPCRPRCAEEPRERRGDDCGTKCFCIRSVEPWPAHTVCYCHGRLWYGPAWIRGASRVSAALIPSISPGTLFL